MLYYIGAHLYLYEHNIMSISTILHRVGSAAHTYLYVYINAVYTSTASILKDMSRIWSIVYLTQTGVSCNHIGYSSTDRGSYSHIVHTRLPATWPYLSPDTCQNKLCTLNLREGEDRSLKLQPKRLLETSDSEVQSNFHWKHTKIQKYHVCVCLCHDQVMTNKSPWKFQWIDFFSTSSLIFLKLKSLKN